MGSFRKLHVRCVVQKNAIVLGKILWREYFIVVSKIHLKSTRLVPQRLHSKVAERNRLVHEASTPIKDENAAFFGWFCRRILGNRLGDCLTSIVWNRFEAGLLVLLSEQKRWQQQSQGQGAKQTWHSSLQ